MQVPGEVLEGFGKDTGCRRVLVQIRGEVLEDSDADTCCSGTDTLEGSGADTW